MRPLNEYIMLKKNPKIDQSKGIVLPDGVKTENVVSTGYKVMAIAEGVTVVKPGDTVYVDQYAEGAELNGMVFCKATSIVAIKEE